MSWIRMHHSIVLEPRSPVSFPHGALPRDRQTRHAPTRRRKSDDSGTTGSDAPGLGRKHPWALPRKKGTPLKGVGTGKRRPVFPAAFPENLRAQTPEPAKARSTRKIGPKRYCFGVKNFHFSFFRSRRNSRPQNSVMFHSALDVLKSVMGQGSQTLAQDASDFA